MPAGDTDLNLLVALRALLEEANVTRAGERIRMGQSTMSAALSRLRLQFGDELLVRVGRDYELTPLARQLLPQIQATLPLVEQVLGPDQGIDPDLLGRQFTVQLTDYAAVEVRPLFRALEAGSDGIRIDLVRGPGDPAGPNRDLLDRDFVIAPAGAGVEGESFELFRDVYVVVADREHPAIQGGEITADDFRRLSHARAEMGRGILTPAQRRMSELGISVETRVVTGSQLALPSIIAATDLIAVLPRRLAERTAAATGTTWVPTPFGTVELIERMWWHPAHIHDPGHRWFRETVAATVAAGDLESTRG